jgi:hypothetical protein
LPRPVGTASTDLASTSVSTRCTTSSAMLIWAR